MSIVRCLAMKHFLTLDNLIFYRHKIMRTTGWRSAALFSFLYSLHSTIQKIKLTYQATAILLNLGLNDFPVEIIVTQFRATKKGGCFIGF